jgi:osmotically-inducible protein OsmY
MKMFFRMPIFFMATFLLVSCASTSTHENPGQFIQSGAITVAVKANLAADPDINSLLITVSTYKNVVFLGGYADSYIETYQAVELARHVDGVKGVINNMVVRPAE